MSVDELIGTPPSISSVEISVGHRTLPCAHCGEPTECEATQAVEEVFCCSGCRGAYELIHGWGLQDYYALRNERSDRSRAGEGKRDVYFAAFDSDGFLGPSAPVEQTDGTMVTELAVHGLHCAACAWLIESAAARTRGWQSARVRMSDHTLKLTFDPERIQLSQIAKLLDRLGYELVPLPRRKDDHFRSQNRRLLSQIAIAGFCAANAMWIAIALYSGEATGLAANHREFLRWMGTGLGFAAVVVPGRTFFVGALASLRMRTPHMDLPVALGLSVGTASSLTSVTLGGAAVYFDSLAVLVFLLLVGRWIQFHQQNRAARSVDLLLRVTPRHASRLGSDGRSEIVLTDALQVGDTIRVAAGASIPADGKIVQGETLIDRSLLTGESVPVEATINDEVNAGTINVQRQVDVQVSAIGSESRVGKVMQSVEEATARKTPIVQLADRIGGVFVVVVVVLAAITFVGWINEGWAIAATNATALLIVACPCALALATPLAVAVSIGRAARQQILIRDSGSLQQLSKPGVIWFDKTGTLTRGRPSVELIYGDPEAILHAAAIERECHHPVADAIVREAFRQGNALPVNARLDRVCRGGVSGVSEGRRIDVGNLDLMRDQGIILNGEIASVFDDCDRRGTSPTIIAIDRMAVAVLSVSDQLKGDAIDTVRQLTEGGWRVGILSGDQQAVVDRVAREANIEQRRAFGGLSPEEKLDRVRQTGADTVVMIGDGANDAAALAAADVGIAIRGGAEASLQAAPVFVASNSLASVTDLLAGSKRTMSLVHAAFATSLAYNMVAIGLAMAGRISPLIAAILMPISSITVLSLTLAWPTFREHHR